MNISPAENLFQKNSPLKTAAIVLLVLVIMYFGRILLIPVFFAILISFILYPACKWLESKKVPRSGAIAICLTAVILPVIAVCYILVIQIIDIGNHWSFILQKLSQVPWIAQFMDLEPVQPGEKNKWLNTLITKNSSQVFSGVVLSISTLVQIVIVPFYTALILQQRGRLLSFIQHLFPPEDAARVKSILQETVITYYNFVKGMLIVYLVVGILNSVGLALLGIPHAIIYGFSASILTFIPYVGIMIASVMPIITAWAMYDSIYYPLGVAGIFMFVQFLEANLIFPLAVSYRVRINMLFTLMAIFLGGIVWGGAGMILFIPFVAIVKLIADKTDRYKELGKILGGEPEVKPVVVVKETVA